MIGTQSTGQIRFVLSEATPKDERPVVYIRGHNRQVFDTLRVRLFRQNIQLVEWESESGTVKKWKKTGAVYVLLFTPQLASVLSPVFLEERVIIWDPESRATHQQMAQLLLAGVQAVVRNNESVLRDLIVAQACQIAVEAESTKQLLALGERNGIVGTSRPLLALLQHIHVVSQHDAVLVLLEGETGTGKELVARAIHNENEHSCRQPFKAVNCATLRGDMALSALFGFKKGSFTGAVETRPGLLEIAGDGTIFLDEVHQLDGHGQTILLRTLQDKSFLPVGATEEKNVSKLRIIASCNTSLSNLVAADQFRDDLYYRLNVLNLHVPSLAQRRSDIPLLASHLVAKYSQYHCASVCEIAPDVLDALQSLPWPGNVRQLENVLIGALVHKKAGKTLEFQDLPPAVLRQIALSAQSAEQEENSNQNGDTGFHLSELVSLTEAYLRVDKWLVSQALIKANGNQSAAADLLGTSRGNIRKKIRAAEIVMTTQFEE